MTKEEVITTFSSYAVNKLFEALLNVGRQTQEVFKKGVHKKFVREYKKLCKEEQRQIEDAIKIISKRK